MNTAHQTAALIAVSFKRSNQNRARISNVGVLRLSRRPRLTSAFVCDVLKHIAEYGITMIEIEGGGFGLLHSDALRAAKTLALTNHLDESEVDAPDLRKLEVELMQESTDFKDNATL